MTTQIVPKKQRNAAHNRCTNLGLYSLKGYASYSYLFNQSYDAYLFSE